jgi:molybdenum cofactor guanylyltransferase
MKTGIDQRDITAIILAGGKGSRMGGQDKGLLRLRDKPLIQWVIQGLAAQVGHQVISANRNQEAYLEYGCPVVADRMDDYQGPLAGIAAALEQIGTPWVLVVPVDTPLLPATLAQHLALAVASSDSDLAVVDIDGEMQPAHILFRSELRESISDFLASGQRKLQDWVRQQNFVAVNFNIRGFEFMNINNEELLARLEENS